MFFSFTNKQGFLFQQNYFEYSFLRMILKVVKIVIRHDILLNEIRAHLIIDRSWELSDK